MMSVSPWMVRPPTFADATLSTGLSRTVTVEALLIQNLVFYSSARVDVVRIDQCYAKSLASINPAILPGQPRPRRPCEVGAKPTRSRHCKRLASRQTHVTGS